MLLLFDIHRSSSTSFYMSGGFNFVRNFGLCTTLFSNIGLCHSGADQRDYLFFIAQGYYKLGVSVGSITVDVDSHTKPEPFQV